MVAVTQRGLRDERRSLCNTSSLRASRYAPGPACDGSYSALLSGTILTWHAISPVLRASRYASSQTTAVAAPRPADVSPRPADVSPRAPGGAGVAGQGRCSPCDPFEFLSACLYATAAPSACARTVVGARSAACACASSGLVSPVERDDAQWVVVRSGTASSRHHERLRARARVARSRSLAGRDDVSVVMSRTAPRHNERHRARESSRGRGVVSLTAAVGAERSGVVRVEVVRHVVALLDLAAVVVRDRTPVGEPHAARGRRRPDRIDRHVRGRVAERLGARLSRRRDSCGFPREWCEEARRSLARHTVISHVGIVCCLVTRALCWSPRALASHALPQPLHTLNDAESRGRPP